MRVEKLAIWPFLFFSLILSSSARAKKYERVLLPAFMAGAQEDPAQDGHYLSYPGGEAVYQKVYPAKKKGEDIPSFVSHLLHLYQTDNKEKFKELFTEDARKTLEAMGEEKFEHDWNSLSKTKNAFLNFYFPKDGGTVVSWRADEIPRALFLRKTGDGYKIDDFKAAKDDLNFHNRSLFFTFLPGKEEKAAVLKSFSLEDEEYGMEIKVDPKYPFVHIFKQERPDDAGEEPLRWEPKVVVEDNQVGKYQFDDLDPRVGVVKIKFEKEHFTQGREHELLILQSDYSIRYYPLELAPKGNVVVK